MRSPVVFARLRRALAPVSATGKALMVAAAVALSAARSAGQPASGPGGPPAQDLTKALAALASPLLPALPPAADFRAGPRTVAAGESVTGPVAVSNGSVEVSGTVTGDVVTWKGDIVVRPGGSITGNAITIGGKVRVEGGQVGGQTLLLGGDATAGAADAGSATGGVLSRLALVAGWLAVLIVISVGVLVLASDNLSAVADALERHYANTLVAGVAGQVALLPLLAALLIALILSVLGILLVPFAAVAYVIVAAGLVTLGFLATAVVVGRGWRAAPPDGEGVRRAATLRAMVAGIIVLLAPWFIAALLTPWPAAATIARGVAFAVTWVACTAGLGAAIISRAGIKRARSPQAQRAMASPSWQTPTPVSGVVAARRPASTPTAGPR